MNNIIEDIDYIIEEMDYKRLKKIEEIKNKYFSEILRRKKRNPKVIFFAALGLFFFVVFPVFDFIVEKNNNSILVDFSIKLDKLRIYSFLLMILFTLIAEVIDQKEKMIKEYKIEKEKDNLSVVFFVNKLKEEDLEIPKEKMKYYKIFLNRYIQYFIYKADNKLNSISESYFDEKYVSFLTIEELFLSAFIFPTYRSFIYIYWHFSERRLKKWMKQ